MGFSVGNRTNTETEGVIKASEATNMFQHGCKYMFVARVLVGRYTKGRKEFRKPPEMFNSCVNDERNPQVFVIFDSSQSYPEYLVEYR